MGHYAKGSIPEAFGALIRIKKGGEYMRYITGDVHGDHNRFYGAFLPNERSLTDKDYALEKGLQA